MRVRIHRPTVRGRLRADRGLLVLTALIVALTSALLAAIWPLTVRTADDAMAASVREAGPGAAVVATLPQPPAAGERRRYADAPERFALDVKFTGNEIPDRLASVVHPSVASYVSPSLPVDGAGPRRTLRLVYAVSPTEPPAVTWVAGRAPGSSAGPGEADIVVAEGDAPWPVQVGLSERAAAALGVGPGARLTLEDQSGQDVDVRVSGIYTPDRPDDPAWAVARELLSPAVGTADGIERTSVAALVSSEALPDLRVAVPSDHLTQRITYLPDPEAVRWEQTSALRRDVVELRAMPGLDSGQTGWDGALDRVLADASAEVARARGRAQVVLLGLLATAALTMVLAARLLARRRAGPLTLARERGATLVGIGAELTIEAVLVAVVGTALGVGVTAALLGSLSLSWVLPVVVVAVVAAPVLGTVEADRATGARREPANRAARRVAGRRRRVRRVVLEAGVVVLAGVTFVALQQRGPVTGDAVPASTPTVWALVGALVLVRLLPLLGRRLLRGAGRSAAALPFFVAARVVAGGLSALPLVVVVVAVAQVAFCSILAATQQRGQEAGALLAVGGDARLESVPGEEVSARAGPVGRAPGVVAAVAGRVADGTLVSAVSTGASVRLVVVDARAYERLLAASDLPDAPQLERLAAAGGEGAPVPALLLGGPSGLEDGLQVRWGDRVSVPLDVVGEAPRVDAATDPVVVVDAAAFAAAGAVADPDTIWAVGPGAPQALRSAAEVDPSDAVTTYDDVLTRLRAAPLPAALVHLAVTASLLLLLLAGLGVVLGAAVDAPARATALGRLRSLGLGERELRRVLAGELLVPVLAGVVVGVVVGVATAWSTFGLLGLEQVTGQSEQPQLVVPLWTGLTALAPPLVALVVAARQSSRIRRTDLARLLRSGDVR
ncbi:FtsX-like permease family protein [Nocardioides sp. URHA0020]|uniref:FtsX-like permease family protein n=1 Tax=Nocardioides sp. URHA0020 TaxID=1380392 RepID=UPI000491F437|nr:FtsX-like permease family protein [Nocardioides sp. URHA0020]